MTFETISRDHLPACAQLFVDVFKGEPWNEHWHIVAVLKRLEECAETPGFTGVLARDTDLVGFAIGYVETWDSSKHFFLKEMCVKHDVQRSGVGTQMMEHLEKALQGSGVEKVYLLTARDSSAEAFYKKNGFYVSPKMVLMGKYLAPEGRSESGAEE